MTPQKVVIVFAVCQFAVSLPALGQRGMGDASGVVRQAADVERITLDGTVQQVIIGPCHNTTGKYPIGMHILLRTSDGIRNVHLGPASQLQKIGDQLTTGQPVSVQAFRTDKMPEDHCVAITLKANEEAFRLRGDDLRPRWADSQTRRQGSARTFRFDQGHATRSRHELGASYMNNQMNHRKRGAWGRNALARGHHGEHRPRW